MYRAVKRRCRTCAVVGLDILDQAGSDRYIRSFYARLSSTWRKRLTVVGIHNYSDVNRSRSRGTKKIIDTVRRYNKRTKFWFTETGALASFGRSFPYSERRQASRMRNMFTYASRYKRFGVERMASGGLRAWPSAQDFRGLVAEPAGLAAKALVEQGKAERVTDVAEMPELERYMLALLSKLDMELKAAVEGYDFNGYARALTGSQAHGDAFVRASLEAIVAKPDEFPRDVDPRLGLYKTFHAIWSTANVGPSRSTFSPRWRNTGESPGCSRSRAFSRATDSSVSDASSVSRSRARRTVSSGVAPVAPSSAIRASWSACSPTRIGA